MTHYKVVAANGFELWGYGLTSKWLITRFDRLDKALEEKERLEQLEREDEKKCRR